MRRWLIIGLLLSACGDDGPARTAYFDLEGELAGIESYWNFPLPSDLRLASSGAPDLAGYPNPRNVPILNALLAVAADRRGWPTMPNAYVRFTAPVPERAITDAIPPADDAVVLLDIDPSSPELGTMYPLVATTLPPDRYYVPSDLVALAPRPGIVLRSATRYAYVIRTGFAPGFTPPAAFTALAAGRASGSRGIAATALYAPLWPALAVAGIPEDDVLVATVFTTGDEVARAFARSEAVRDAHAPVIENLALVNGANHDGFCELHGTITMPQFQEGSPPFDSQGRFVLDGNDLPTWQGDLTIPIAITLPKTAMPQAGWPLYQFFHGSGGHSTDVVDLGRQPTADGIPEPGKGPGYVVARHGIGAASAALPVNPERQPGASDYAYLNINNLSAFPYTFQQGVFEQRLFLDALLALQIPQAAVAGCGIVAPGGNAMHHFDPTKLVAGGQSMGGMYTNMIGAVEPRLGALVPTGAGGLWNLMILETEVIRGARSLLGTALGVDDSELVFVHPGLNALALGWEIAEPLAYMARLGRRPLPGMSARHVYQSTPFGDENFTPAIYDAAALAYGNEQAGDVVWPSMQEALVLDGLDGLVAYPVRGNLDGNTRIAVQFMGDGIVDPHYIYRQLDAVKRQYGCFFASYLRDGVPTVPAPGALTDPCP